MGRVSPHGAAWRWSVPRTRRGASARAPRRSTIPLGILALSVEVARWGMLERGSRRLIWSGTAPFCFWFGHGRTGSGSAVGASGSGWSAPPRVTCCTATYSRGARCHGLNRLGVFRIYIHIYVHRYLVRPPQCPIPQTRVSARRYIRRYTPSTRLNVTPHRIESPTHRESRRHSSGP